MLENICSQCREKLVPVSVGKEEDGTAMNLGQYEDSLQVYLCGGYGMLYDILDADNEIMINLCKDCGTRLFKQLNLEIPG